MENLSYDKTSPKSIFEYAIPLLDHTLREMVGDEAVQGYNMKGKGTLGQMVEELYYHYKANSNPTPDFEEAGVGLKTTGMIKLKDLSLNIEDSHLVYIRLLLTTNALHTSQEILPQYTNSILTNPLYERTYSYLNHIQSNGLNAQFHLTNEHTDARYRHRSVSLQASALS